MKASQSKKITFAGIRKYRTVCCLKLDEVHNELQGRLISSVLSEKIRSENFEENLSTHAVPFVFSLVLILQGLFPVTTLFLRLLPQRSSC